MRTGKSACATKTCAATMLFLGDGRLRLGEARVGNGCIGLYLLGIELVDFAAVGPGEFPGERDLHAADRCVITVIDLRGDTSHGRGGVAHLAHEQAAIAIEDELDE